MTSAPLLLASVPEGHPLVPLDALLGPYLWLSEICQVHVGPQPAPPGAALPWMASVSGLVKYPPDFCSAIPVDWATARRLRRALYDRAESAVEAAELAGWTHEGVPAIDIAGELRTWSGKAGILPDVTLRMRLWPPWCPCGHGEDDICLNGSVYGSCGDPNCGGGCGPDAGICRSLPGCCARRAE